MDESRVNQTIHSFGQKWQRNSSLLVDEDKMTEAGVLDWILQRNGLASVEEARAWLKGRQRILDAGCGNGRITTFLRRVSDAETELVAVDINPDAAMENLKDLPNVCVVKQDLTTNLSSLGEFDLIYCQEVLHHTSNPRGAFLELSRLLSDGGEIAIYVYKRKALVREATDDLVRELVKDMSYDEAMAHMRDLAALGKALAGVDDQVTTPAVPLLGIPGGTYPVQRLVYHFFLKCFWNHSLSRKMRSLIWFGFIRRWRCVSSLRKSGDGSRKRISGSSATSWMTTGSRSEGSPSGRPHRRESQSPHR